jgi:Ca2+-binding RTX toxin-like protein
MYAQRIATSAICAALCLAVGLSVGRAAGDVGPVPSCAEGPEVVGRTIVGTPCGDLIVAPPGVAAVEGGGGNDTIVPAPIAAAVPCTPSECLGIGSQTFEGGPGDDVVYGERGNDRLSGGAGNDQLFGGIGDDLLKGGPGNDRLSGGFGADSIDGEGDDDYVRGDATADTILDTGGGNDTLSYSTGIAPGFFSNHAFDAAASKGLPPLDDERGVYVDLGGTVGDNGVAPFGGGVDKVEGASFETVIGTAFSDYIVGSEAGETIYGGGGGDAILGKGGDDTLRGGADGDHLDGGEGADSLDGGPGSDHCQSGAETACDAGNTGGVVLRDPGRINVGAMAPEDPRYVQLYLSGSSGADTVTATYSPASVTFALGPGPVDASPGCEPPSGGQVVCPLGKPLDSIVIAGFDGNDTLQANGFPASAGVVIAGGEGGDSLSGGAESEDVLADDSSSDAAGDDTLTALGRDDALLNNGGADQLSGGDGNDLFLSNSICGGDRLNGDAGRDNASWAKFTASGVEVRLDSGKAGRPGGAAPICNGGTLDSLEAFEDLEGTVLGDVFYGDVGENQLLGWEGEDVYSSGGGNDRILANSGDHDPTIECGDGDDTALIDHPPLGDVAAADCENVHEGDPNSFRIETQLPPPNPPVEPPATGPTVTTSPTGETEEDRHHPPPKSRPQRTCLSGYSAGKPHCSQRPHRVAIGALGLVNRLHWRHWSARRTIGIGHLTVSGGCCDRGISARAKIVASRLESCDSRHWYTRLTIIYGRGYRKTYVRSYPSPTPCV